MKNPELAAIHVQGVTRQSFLVKGAIAAGSVYGLSTVAPFVSEAIAQEGGGDVEVLNFALTLEYLESAFYEQALENVSGLGADAKKLATTIQQNEAEHVDALAEAIKSLGGTPVKAPMVDFGDSFSSEKAFLKTAQTFEDLGVSAYNGAAPNIKSKEVLGSAGSIVQVEARHAAAIRELNGQPITEAAFDKALKMPQVLQAVKPYVKS
jgi:rubrerythrin